MSRFQAVHHTSVVSLVLAILFGIGLARLGAQEIGETPTSEPVETNTDAETVSSEADPTPAPEGGSGILAPTVVESTLDPAPVRPVRPAPVPRPHVTDTIVEVATRSEKEMEDVIPAVGVITEQEIARIAPLSFDDLIRTQPNVETVGGPRYLGEQLVIRGEGGNAVTVRIDDARQNFVSGHAGQRFFVETDFLKQVEILRGAGSFLYGSGSAGVVNLSTLDPEDLLNESGAMGLRVRNSYNTNSEEWANSVIGTASSGKVSLMLGASDRDGNNITLADGVQLPNSAIEREGRIGKFVWTPNDANRFEVGMNYYTSEDQGAANPQGNVDLQGNPTVGRTIDYIQWNAGWEYDPEHNDLVDFDLDVYYNNTKQVRNYLDPGANLGRQNVHDLDVFGIDLVNRSIVYTGDLEHELVYGLEFFTETQEGGETRDTFFIPGSPGNASGRPDAEADHFAVFLTDEVDLTDRLTLFGGFRYDTYSTLKTAGVGAAQEDSAFTPNVGFDLDLTENLSLVGRYSKAFTEPTLNDLYQDGSHFGVVPSPTRPLVQTVREAVTGAFTPPGGQLPQPGLLRWNYYEEVFIPNPDLLPETSDNFELGIHYENDDVNGGRLSARLTGFYKQGENTFDSEIVGTRTVSPYTGFANPGGTPANVPGVNIPTFVTPGPFAPPIFIGTVTPFSGQNFRSFLEQDLRQTVNRDETEIYGAELSIDYDTDYWFANLSAGMLRGEDITTGQKLNSITGGQVALTLGVRPFESLELGAYGIWNGGREDLVSDPNNMTSGYDIYGLFATFQATENWQLRAGVDNLFDQAHQRSTIAQDEPGRAAVFSSTFTW